MPTGWPKKATGNVAGATGGGSGLVGDAVGEGVGTGSTAGDGAGRDGAAAPAPGGAVHAWIKISTAEAASTHLIALTEVGN